MAEYDDPNCREVTARAAADWTSQPYGRDESCRDLPRRDLIGRADRRTEISPTHLLYRVDRQAVKFSLTLCSFFPTSNVSDQAEPPGCRMAEKSDL